MASESKTLVLCFDGTTNEYSSNNSNVAKLYSILDKNQPTKQVCYYQPGLGQYFDSSILNVVPFLGKAMQGLDWAVAWYLYQHVIDGYRFIIQNWSQGDRIYIFGFSRGAYTARCVAGMVQKIGLLFKDNDQTLSFAYSLYERTDDAGIALASSYKRAFARDVKIDFVGVFDTVASVGMIVNRELPFTSLNPGIKVFRHALALDERRFRFTYSGWSGPVAFPPLSNFGVTPQIRIPASLSGWFQGVWWKLTHPIEIYHKFEASRDLRAQNPSLTLTDILLQPLRSSGVPMPASYKIQKDDRKEDEPSVPKGDVNKDVDVREVWFVGCHEDIGGCAVTDDTSRSLGDITLRWMVKQLLQVKASVHFAPDAVENLLGPELDNNGQLVKPDFSAGPHVDLDSLDCSKQIHDSLAYPMWWGFEFLPLSWTWQDEKGNWYRQWRLNFGRGRHIEGNPLLHRSVQLRMSDSKLNYSPQAHIKKPLIFVSS